VKYDLLNMAIYSCFFVLEERKCQRCL